MFCERKRKLRFHKGQARVAWMKNKNYFYSVYKRPRKVCFEVIFWKHQGFWIKIKNTVFNPKKTISPFVQRVFKFREPELEIHFKKSSLKILSNFDLQPNNLWHRVNQGKLNGQQVCVCLVWFFHCNWSTIFINLFSVCTRQMHTQVDLNSICFAFLPTSCHSFLRLLFAWPLLDYRLVPLPVDRSFAFNGHVFSFRFGNFFSPILSSMFALLGSIFIDKKLGVFLFTMMMILMFSGCSFSIFNDIYYHQNTCS